MAAMIGRTRFLKRLLLDLPRNLKLAYCLWLDPRVPVRNKAALGAAIGLIVTPYVNLPAWIPVVGEMDILALSLIASRLFIGAAPDYVVAEQEALIKRRESRFDRDVEAGRRIAAPRGRADAPHLRRRRSRLLGPAPRTGDGDGPGPLNPRRRADLRSDTVKVLFLQEVTGTAKPGDVKEVSPGFARNYLFPKRLAVVADDKVVEQIRHREEATRRRAEKALTDARDIDSRLRRITVTLYAKAGEGGRLFGSVTNADIAQQLKREAGIDVDKRKIEVEPPIRSLGPHEVTLNLHAEVTATLRVVVAAK